MKKTSWLLALLAALVGCGSDEPEIVADPFVIPLEKTSLDGQMIGTLLEAMPSPPARGVNTWRVLLTDADGEPIDTGTPEVVPWMPGHGHGTSATTVAPTGVPGEYLVTRMNFIMGGVWEVRFAVPQSSADRDVLFYVAVPD